MTDFRSKKDGSRYPIDKERWRKTVRAQPGDSPLQGALPGNMGMFPDQIDYGSSADPQSSEGPPTLEEIAMLNRAIQTSMEADIQSDPKLQEELTSVGIHPHGGNWVSNAFTAEGGFEVGNFSNKHGFEITYSYGAPYKLETFGYPMKSYIFQPETLESEIVVEEGPGVRAGWKHYVPIRQTPGFTEEEREKVEPIAQRLTDVANSVIEQEAAEHGYIPVEGWSNNKELLTRSEAERIEKIRAPKDEIDAARDQELKQMRKADETTNISAGMDLLFGDETGNYAVQEWPDKSFTEPMYTSRIKAESRKEAADKLGREGTKWLNIYTPHGQWLAHNIHEEEEEGVQRGMEGIFDVNE